TLVITSTTMSRLRCSPVAVTSWLCSPPICRTSQAYTDLSDSQRAITHLESDKSAKGRHYLVGRVRFAYGDPDPLGPKAGEGFATAYGEAVIAQGEADPAGFAISSYPAGIDQHERALRQARDCEADVGKSLHQVCPSTCDLLGRCGGKSAGVAAHTGDHCRQ